MQGRYNRQILMILEFFMPLPIGDGNRSSFAILSFEIDPENSISFYP